ncbi:MAG: IclR family transcriptional regulator [Desulfarculaceae bacterium]|nr:IclR family transcriptional regulator [Desulfarculaceae bacterium]MCF8048210.1 IclR family transcriptional regulator [Desulfarculaceae bacterium]MCF8065812.1 IclR family transcriptional regulator [Desulfarculaceae bacterium]MCF8099181.1 IclR family transcriptional regulator [Desulfarculaceae bacterium]MCF8123572.1 IclR family transcriptional regulator [Desulfarculaceae bacterium]
MTGEKHSRYFVHSLEKGLSVLRAFAKKGPNLTLSEISQVTGMVPPTATRFIRTLEDLGYLLRDPSTRTYSLSPKILSIGFSFIENIDIRQRVSRYLLEITKQMNVDTACAILDHTEVVYIERFRSNSVVSLHLTVGSRLPAYNSAMGRAILAFMDPKDAEGVIDASELVAHTPNTITDKGALLKRLDEVREAGFAINKQELVLGMAAIAAPVMKGATAEGSIGASFPVQLLEQEGFFDEVKERIVGTAKKVAL